MKKMSKKGLKQRRFFAKGQLVLQTKFGHHLTWKKVYRREYLAVARRDAAAVLHTERAVKSLFYSTLQRFRGD